MYSQFRARVACDAIILDPRIRSRYRVVNNKNEDVSMNFDPAHLKDPRIKRAYAYWDAARGGREMPGRVDIDPEDIKDILPYVLLVDVIAEPLDFRFRVAGTDVVQRFGEEITAKRLGEIDLDGKFASIFAEYRQTVDRRKPALFSESFLRDDKRFVSYSRLLCPLSKDGERVDMLFGVQVAESDAYLPRPSGVHHI